MPAEVLPSIFQPFVQADSSSTRRHGGLGLGLTIVRNLTELHGGSVSAKNLPEGGASFQVLIPIAALHVVAPPPPIAREAEAREKSNSIRLDGAKILFVDDHAQSREVVTAMLSHAGASVVAKASVAEALDVVNELQPDLIMTDIALPESDGFELAREVRERQRTGALRRVRVIAFTAFRRAGISNPDADILFDDWLLKPLDPADLTTAVVRNLGRI